MEGTEVCVLLRSETVFNCDIGRLCSWMVFDCSVFDWMVFDCSVLDWMVFDCSVLDWMEFDCSVFDWKVFDCSVLCVGVIVWG